MLGREPCFGEWAKATWWEGPPGHRQYRGRRGREGRRGKIIPALFRPGDPFRSFVPPYISHYAGRIAWPDDSYVIQTAGRGKSSLDQAATARLDHPGRSLGSYINVLSFNATRRKCGAPDQQWHVMVGWWGDRLYPPGK